MTRPGDNPSMSSTRLPLQGFIDLLRQGDASAGVLDDAAAVSGDALAVADESLAGENVEDAMVATSSYEGAPADSPDFPTEADWAALRPVPLGNPEPAAHVGAGTIGGWGGARAWRPGPGPGTGKEDIISCATAKDRGGFDVTGRLEFPGGSHDITVFKSGSWQQFRGEPGLLVYAIKINLRFLLQFSIPEDHHSGIIMLVDVHQNRAMHIAAYPPTAMPEGSIVFKGVDAFEDWVFVMQIQSGRGLVIRPLRQRDNKEAQLLMAVFDRFGQGEATLPPIPEAALARLLVPPGQMLSHLSARVPALHARPRPSLTPEEGRRIAEIFSTDLSLAWEEARPPDPPRAVVDVEELLVMAVKPPPLGSNNTVEIPFKVTNSSADWWTGKATLAPGIALDILWEEEPPAGGNLILRHVANASFIMLQDLRPVIDPRHPGMICFEGASSGLLFAVVRGENIIFVRWPDTPPLDPVTGLLWRILRERDHFRPSLDDARIFSTLGVPEAEWAVAAMQPAPQVTTVVSPTMSRFIHDVTMSIHAGRVDPKAKPRGTGTGIPPVRPHDASIPVQPIRLERITDARARRIRAGEPPGVRTDVYEGRGASERLVVKTSVTDHGGLGRVDAMCSGLAGENSQEMVLLPIGTDTSWTLIPTAARSGVVRGFVGAVAADAWHEPPRAFESRAIDLSSYPVARFRREEDTAEGNRVYVDREKTLMLVLWETPEGPSGIISTAVSPQDFSAPTLGAVWSTLISNRHYLLGSGPLHGVRLEFDPEALELTTRMPRAFFPTCTPQQTGWDGAPPDIDPKAANTTVLQTPSDPQGAKGNETRLVFQVAHDTLPAGILKAAVLQFSGRGLQRRVTGVKIETLPGCHWPVVPGDLHENHTIPGEPRAETRYAYDFRIGPYRFQLHFSLAMLFLGVRSIPPVHYIMWGCVRDYERRLAAKDQETRIRKAMADLRTLTGYQSPVRWTSAARPSARDWILLNSGRDVAQGTAVAVRLGRTGQGRLRLTNGQQVFVRITTPAPPPPQVDIPLPDGSLGEIFSGMLKATVREYDAEGASPGVMTYEFIYLWQGGRLVPWRGQAPAGDVRLALDNEALRLEWQSGLVAEALQAAFPAWETPEIGLEFTPTGEFIAARCGDRSLTAAEIQENSVAEISAFFLVTLSEIIDGCRQERSGSLVRIDFTPAPLEAQDPAPRPAPKPITPPTPVQPEPSKRERQRLEKAARRAVREATAAAAALNGGDQNGADPGTDTPDNVTNGDGVSGPGGQDVRKGDGAAPQPPTAHVYLCDDEFLPRIEFEGPPRNPTKLILVAGEARTGLTDLAVSHDSDDRILIMAACGEAIHEYAVVFKDGHGTITRVDEDWPAERAILVAARERELKAAARLWVWDEAQGELRLINGLKETVTTTQGHPVVIPGRMILGDIYLTPGAGAQGLLAAAGVTATGNVWRIAGLDPLLLDAAHSLAPELVPLRPGQRVPLVDLTALYEDQPVFAQHSTDEIAAVDQALYGALRAAPLLIPTARSLSGLYGKDATAVGSHKTSLAFVNDRGVTVRVPVTRSARGWGCHGQLNKSSLLAVKDVRMVDV